MNPYSAKNPEFGFCIQTCKSFFSCFFVNDPKSLFTFFGLALIDDVE